MDIGTGYIQIMFQKDLGMFHSPLGLIFPLLGQILSRPTQYLEHLHALITDGSIVHWGVLDAFLPSSEWFYNNYEGTYFAYCRGVVSLTFPASVIHTNSSDEPFMFSGPHLLLNGNATLDNDTFIVLAMDQFINFTNGVKLGGILHVQLSPLLDFINDTDVLEQNFTITPIYYNSYSIQFGGVDVLLDREDVSRGCDVSSSSVSYGETSMEVIFQIICNPGDPNGSSDTVKKIVIGAVVGVGGCAILTVVLGVIVGIVAVTYIRNRERKVAAKV